MKKQVSALIVTFVFAALLIFINSCSKCTEIYITTVMNVYPNADSLEITKYNTLLLLIQFDYDYEKMCKYKTGAKWKNQIKYFSVISNNDYNENYKKGSNLEEIIDMTYQYKPGNFWNEETVSLNDYLISNSECFLKARLILKTKPDSMRLHKLTFNYKETDDSTEYKFETVPFYITP
ncbi:MAG: hypothetical protein K8R54_00255 [Bacteroidales bacterium]|nr:hypothetical protein [Bacteroidales bacterium]